MENCNCNCECVKNFKETFLTKYNCTKSYIKENSGFLITVLLFIIALLIFIKVIADFGKARELKKMRRDMQYVDYMPYDDLEFDDE
ncbi:MAG: hypothetical protein LBM87_01550 [Ruminococcus sp.]|jgi:hypothetical protein|nr:hypothetical protein [Ruminococcus sp.]